MHESPIKDRLIVASPKSAMKPLPRTVTSIFRLHFRQMEHIMTNKGFLQVIFTGNFFTGNFYRFFILLIIVMVFSG